MTTPSNNLGAIHALRQRNLLTAGALYALGHTQLAEEADVVYGQLPSARSAFIEINQRLRREYPDADGWVFDERAVPAELLAEYERAERWDTEMQGRAAQLGPAIEAIIASLYDDATITAEEGQCL